MKHRKPLWAPIAATVAFVATTIVIAVEIIINLIDGILKTIARSIGVASRYRKMFVYLYKKMRPAVVCEICKKPGNLQISSCCNRWVHEACHERDAMSKMAQAFGGDELARMMNSDMN